MRAWTLCTVPELAHRKAESLYDKLVKAHRASRLVRLDPSQAQVNAWIVQARTLPRVIEH